MACRLNSINEILKKQISNEKFNELCDSFDKEIGFEEKISRTYFYVGEGMKNIFSFILEKTENIKTEYIPPSEESLNEMYTKVSTNKEIKLMIVFNRGHAWSLNKKKDTWFMRRKVYKFFGRPNDKSNRLYRCGFVLIYSK